MATSPSHEAFIRVRLLHKPKGFGVQWKALSEDELIRVNDRGKPLVVEVAASPACGEINWSSLELKLVDTGKDRFFNLGEADKRGKVMWEIKEQKSAFFDHTPFVKSTYTKIYLRPTTVAFQATLSTADGKLLTAISTHCRTSNSIPSKANQSGRKNQRDVTLDLPMEEGATEGIQIKAEPHEDPEASHATFETKGFDLNTNLKVDGILVSQMFITFSDERLKMDVRDLTDAAAQIASLRGCTFRWKATNADGMLIQSASGIDFNKRRKKVIGFLAQEVAKSVPESVSHVEDGWMVVEYTSILPIFIEALKSHAKRQEGLRAKVEELDELVNNLVSLSKELKAVRARHLTPPSPKPIPKRPRKRTPFSFARTNKSIYLFLAPLIVASVCAIIFGLALGLSPQQPPQPPTSDPFIPRNYISDGGFENPAAAGWAGTASAFSYRSSIDPPGDLMSSSAPFNTGMNFLLLNGSRATLDSTTQRIPVPASGFQVSQGHVWVFLPRVFPSASFIGIELTTFRNTSGSISTPCTSSAYANLSVISTWQRLSVEMPCVFDASLDYQTVSIVASGTSVVAAADNVELFATSQVSSSSGPSFEFEFAISSPRSPKAQQGTQVLQHRQTGFLIGVAELPKDDHEVAIGVARVYSYGRRDYGWGEFGGVTNVEKVKQTNATIQANWFATDEQDRVYVVGRTRIGSNTWIPAAVRLDALDGSLDTRFGAPSGVVPIFTNATIGKFDAAFSVIPFPNGRIFVLSSVNNGQNYAIACLTSSGRLNTSFASPNGLFLVGPSTGSLSAATVDLAGRSLVASISTASIIVSRYDSNGVLDTTFGASGTVGPLATGPSPPFITKFTSLDDGGLLIAGGYSVGSNYDPFVLKLAANGSIDWNADPAFFLIRDDFQNDHVTDVYVHRNGSLIVGVISPSNFTLIQLMSDGQRNLQFSGNGSLVLNTTAWGQLGKFAVNTLDRMIVTSLVLENGVSSDNNIVFPFVTTNNTLQAQTDIYVPPTEGLVPKVNAHVVAFDTFTKRRFYLGSRMQASPVTNRTTFSVLTLDTVTGRPDPSFGFRRSGLDVHGNEDILASEFLDAIVPLQDGRFFFVYSLESSPRRITVERRFSSYLPDSSFGLASRINLPQSSFGLSGARTLLLSTGSMIVAAQTDDRKLWLTCLDSVTGRADSSWNITLTGMNVSTTGSPSRSIFSVEHVEQTAAPWSSLSSFSFFIAANVLSPQNSLSSIILRFVGPGVPDSSFGVNGLSAISVPAGFNESFISHVISIPGDDQFIYATGWLSDGVNKSAFVARVSASSGAVDVSWGEQGFAIVRDIMSGYQAYGKRVFWDDSLRQLVLIGGMAQPTSPERVAVVTIARQTGSIGCISRTYDAYGGIGDAAQVGTTYLVTVKHSRAERAIQFSSPDIIAKCSSQSLCGDGILNASEQCDDNNTISGDGCSSSCTIEASWSCPYPGYACLLRL